MTNPEVLRSHVVRSLRRDLDLRCAAPDDDGDWWVPGQEAPVYVRLLDGEPPLVRVWSPGAHDLPGTARVLREVNDVNAGMVGARVFLRGGTLVVAGELEVESVERGELGRLVQRVGTAAGRVGSMLVTVHGGRRPDGGTAQPALEETGG